MKIVIADTRMDVSRILSGAASSKIDRRRADRWGLQVAREAETRTAPVRAV